MSADAIVKSYIDRILRLKEEQDSLAADIRGIYAEAKANGYDKTAMGALVTHLRKVEKVGVAAVEEGQSVFDLYLSAYERASHTYAPARPREIIEEFDAETGEITEQPETANEVRSGVDTATVDPSAEHVSPPASQVAMGGVSANAGGGDVTDDGLLRTDRSAPNEGKTSLAAREGEQAAASISDDDVPAFLKKDRYVLRPHCLNPSLCAGVGREHCYTCKKAMLGCEVAA